MFPDINKKTKNKLCIIGHFGGDKNLLDGQTVKTKTLYSELKKKIDCQIFCVDTYNKKEHPIKLLLYSLYCLFICDRVIVLLSLNGRKFYFPLLYYFTIIFKKKIYHNNIGGSLHEHLERNPKWLKYMKSFEVNWIEFKSSADKLINAGLNNVEVLPNFKNLNVIEQHEMPDYVSPPYRFCTFSRVSKAKGIPDAIQAIENINRQYGFEIAHLDIYGQPDEDYKDDFSILMTSTTSAVTYKGLVPFDQSTRYLKTYFALLFPTFFPGEGFPGTIIDAFASGLPVIATDWHANAEIIDNNVTGVIYKNNRFLEQTILYAIENYNIINSMRINCLQDANKYMPGENINKIINKFNLI